MKKRNVYFFPKNMLFQTLELKKNINNNNKCFYMYPEILLTYMPLKVRKLMSMLLGQDQGGNCIILYCRGKAFIVGEKHYGDYSWGWPQYATWQELVNRVFHLGITVLESFVSLQLANSCSFYFPSGINKAGDLSLHHNSYGGRIK